MKQVCLQCWREAAVGGLWCQESDCATDDKPIILEYGESLGETRVINTLAVLPAAVIYEAEREDQKVLLKVAHQGFEERLGREAGYLMALQRERRRHPALPTLLPAHARADVMDYPYSRAVLGDQAFCYAVFAHVKGRTLRDLLLEDPQPWYQHAVWMTLALADAVTLMHRAGRLHLCLSPEMTLVRRDGDRVPRPVLLDLGAVTAPGDAGQHWNRRLAFPACVAPELLQPRGGRVGAFTDVYGLGVILYEMLAGRPVYPFSLRAEAEVAHDVLHAELSAINRPDLKNIPQVVERAVSKDYRRRQPDVLALARELQVSVPPVPKEGKNARISWRTLAIVLAAAIAVMALLLLAAASGR